MIYLHDIDPLAFSLGPLKVHWYGLMYLLGFLAAWVLGRRRIRVGRLPGVDVNAFSDLLFYAMLGVILGGRIGYMLFYAFDSLLANPLILFKVWEGGMSFHGGALGVLAACALWARQRGLYLFDVMDFIVPLVPLGLGFGRFGNFVGGELWGKLTHAGWGVIFPHAPLQDMVSGAQPLEQLMSAAQMQQYYAAGVLNQYARHPSQLYEAGLEGLLLFVVLWIFSAKPRPRCAVSGVFALLYGVFRFAVEFIRVPDASIGYLAFHWLTMGQVLSVLLIIFGLSLLWRSRFNQVVRPALEEIVE